MLSWSVLCSLCAPVDLVDSTAGLQMSLWEWSHPGVVTVAGQDWPEGDGVQ